MNTLSVDGIHLRDDRTRSGSTAPASEADSCRNATRERASADDLLAIEHLLQSARFSIPVPRAATAETCIDVPRLLIGMAHAWPQPLNQAQLSTLDALCHKLAVSRSILERYNADWSKPQDAETLSPPYWRLLVALLLAWSQVPASLGGNGDGFGRACKCVNAAFQAIDAAIARCGCEPVESWQHQAAQALKALMDEGTR